MQGERQKEKLYDVIAVAVFLNCLGFPGNFTTVLGGWFGTLTDYGCFLLEIAAMLMSSAESFMDVRLINLKPKYRGIYFILAVFIIDSMAVAGAKGEELITCLRLATTASFMLWICDRYSTEKILYFLCVAQSAFIIAALLLCLAKPGVAFSSASGEYSFVGLHTTKNTAAKELAFGIALGLAYFRHKRKTGGEVPKLFYFTFVMQVAMLLLSNATGALLTTIATVAYIIAAMPKTGREKRLPLGWLFAIASCAFLVAALTVLPLLSGFLEMLGKDATLTGRTELWEAIIDFMMGGHTLTGYGYGMFWRDEAAVDALHEAFDADSFMGNMNTGAHNLILELWLNVGLIGIAALFIGIIDCMKNTKGLNRLQYETCSAIFIISTISGFTERSFASAYSFDVALIFLAMGIACYREEKTKGKQQESQEERGRLAYGNH